MTLGRLVRRRGGYIYTLFLVILWLLAITTLALDWQRFVYRQLQSYYWVDASDNFIVDLWTNVNDVLSTAAVVVADALMVSQACYTTTRCLVAVLLQPND